MAYLICKQKIPSAPPWRDTQEGLTVNLMIGKRFELEVCVGSIFIRAGSFERFWNVYGLASH